MFSNLVDLMEKQADFVIAAQLKHHGIDYQPIKCSNYSFLSPFSDNHIRAKHLFNQSRTSMGLSNAAERNLSGHGED
jgi:hypothetical protein